MARNHGAAEKAMITYVVMFIALCIFGHLCKH
jgi:hypothetical protein